ncbi:hypothetical protein [Labrys wisconsinensis]|uniref:Uncharacterized protein n=1 Tax=Labrys wisconsinensis TaxID=425677 RepID=A0ABU0JCB4_9HYPH|nr:hypothetical protein [Labrys wisconsinensis]MDQ0471028.1 hypothetical protein [Labrys wisconsinensis]
MRRAVTTEPNEALPIERGQVTRSEFALQVLERRGLRAERGLADLAHVRDMKVDEFTERREARDPGGGGVSPRPTWHSASTAQRRASSRRRKVSLTERPLRRT